MICLPRTLTRPALEKFLAVPFFLLAASGLLIPSDGEHGFVNIKSLFFIIAQFAFAFHVFTSRNVKQTTLYLVAFILCTACFLLFFLSVGLINNIEFFEGPFDQLKVFAVTALFVANAIYFFKQKIFSFSFYLKFLVSCNFVYSLGKCLLIVSNIFNVTLVKNLLEMVDFRVMSMDIASGVIRFQTSVDIITPFLIFFVLCSKVDFNRKFKYLYLIISIFSIIISFSRYLMFVAFISFVIHQIMVKFNLLVVCLAVISLTCFGFYYSDQIAESLENRFFSSANQTSDDVRAFQIEKLLGEHGDYPFFGKGLGGSVNGYLRDEKLVHSYEVQWGAFLMQFGFVGILLLFAPLILIALRLNLASLAIFCLWILSGFTNPYLISLTSGIVYSLFYLVADHSRPVSYFK